MLKEKNLKSTVIANEVKQSRQIATPCGLAMTESGRSTSSLSFPCLTRESTWCGLNAPYFTRFAQSGRSMVEMLGVLAVIGVLSVAGVGGYTTAMNKHRANELLNEASKRAAIIAMQLASGKTAPESADNTLITEFTDPTNHTFKVGKANDKQFNIEITGVSESVCQQMKNAFSGVIKGFKPETCADNATVIFTYNNDMSTGDLPSNTGATTVCNGHGYKDSNDDCVCDPGYSGTDCATAACTTGTYCGSGATKECCGTDEVCTTSGDVAGTCVAKGGNIACTTNTSCNDATKYCKLENTEYKCDAPNKGTCTTLDAGRETTYTDPNDTTKTKTFLVSSGYMSWWAADNWCKAHDMKLVSYSTVNRLFDCDKNSRKCTWSKFTTDGYWSNGTLSDYYWTAESYDFCYAWHVDVLNGYFGGNDRDGSGLLYALCE